MVRAGRDPTFPRNAGNDTTADTSDPGDGSAARIRLTCPGQTDLPQPRPFDTTPQEDRLWSMVKPRRVEKELSAIRARPDLRNVQLCLVV